jgi:hypothetical protein
MDFLEKLMGKVPSSKAKEKRIADRRPCNIEVFIKKESEGDFPAIIKDIGIYGVRIEGTKSLKNGEMVSIQAVRDKGIFAKARFTQDSIKAMVVWARKKKGSSDFAAGLKFSDTRSNLRDSWVFIVLSLYGFKASYKEQRRRTVRFPTHLKVKYQEPQGYYNGWGTLVDLGQGGLSMLTNEQVQELVTLDLEIGPYQSLPITFLRGKVMWSGYSKAQKTPMMGVEFFGLQPPQIKMLNKYIIAIVEELAQK